MISKYSTLSNKRDNGINVVGGKNFKSINVGYELNVGVGFLWLENKREGSNIYLIKVGGGIST